MRISCQHLLGVLGVVLLSASGAHAQSLSIVNAGFENPAVADGIFTGGGIPGWNGGTGVWRPPLSLYFTTPVPEGNQIGFTNGSSLAQQLGSDLQAGTTYSLTFDVGRRLDNISGDVSGALWAGGTVTNGAVSGGTLLASSTVTISSLALGEFAPLAASYTTLAADPNIGQPLSIVITKITNTQADFDDVRLTASGGTAAPEPGTFALLLLPLLGVTAHRIRRAK